MRGRRYRQLSGRRGSPEEILSGVTSTSVFSLLPPVRDRFPFVLWMPGSRYRRCIAMRSCAVALVAANRCRRAAVPPCHREETRRAVRKERRDRDRMRKARRRVLREFIAYYVSNLET